MFPISIIGLTLSRIMVLTYHGALTISTDKPSPRVYRPPQLTWRWVFVESVPPFECRVVEMDDMTRKVGNFKAERAIKLWAECLAANKWPGYPRKIETMEYRDWAADRWLEIEV